MSSSPIFHVNLLQSGANRSTKHVGTQLFYLKMNEIVIYEVKGINWSAVCFVKSTALSKTNIKMKISFGNGFLFSIISNLQVHIHWALNYFFYV